MMPDEARELRNRCQTLEDAIARLTIYDPIGGPRYVGQVYNGGNYVAAHPRRFLTHPVTYLGEETASTPAAYAVDSTMSVPVAVFDRTPAIGDILIAHLIENQGQWVAERLPPSHATAGKCGGCTVTTATMNYDFHVTYPQINILTGAYAPFAFDFSGTMTWGTYPIKDQFGLIEQVGPTFYSDIKSIYDTFTGFLMPAFTYPLYRIVGWCGGVAIQAFKEDGVTPYTGLSPNPSLVGTGTSGGSSTITITCSPFHYAFDNSSCDAGIFPSTPPVHLHGVNFFYGGLTTDGVFSQ